MFVCLQGGMCSVFMQESEKVVSISSDHLEPVTPTKNNKVRPLLHLHNPLLLETQTNCYCI